MNVAETQAELDEEGLADDMKLLTGGVAVKRRWAMEEAKADGYAEDAWEYIDLAHEVLGLEPDDSGDIGYGTDDDKVRIR